MNLFRVDLRSTLLVALLGLVSLTTSRAAEPDPDYAKSIESQRADRLERLTTPDGWLTLIGLYFLKEGVNTVGSAADNSIVFTAGPAHLGTVTLSPEGRAAITLNPGVGARINGRELLSAELDDGEKSGAITLVKCGTLTFFLIDRGGKKALRVKDSASPRRTHFLGLDYFPIDPAWRIEADWVPFDRPREVPIRNILGQESPALIPGKAVFKKDGHTYALLPLIEGPDEPLFFVISDATSGDETYGAARFLYADPPRDGKLILDFNLAVNPPCAFTPFATCPLPPKENRLPIAVRAGEKKYRGEHEAVEATPEGK